MRQRENPSRRHGITALLLAIIGVSGCYVVPVTGPDGAVHYSNYPLPPPGIPVAAASTAATLTVRLYPANEQATQTGVINGTVTNVMTGKGRFVVNYLGEVLSGEATRVSNEEKRGVASAYSPGGMYMSCEYQMNTPYQGAGTCSFANGAKYQMHIGN
ncbi:MAG TPA: hypothetical protein PLO14_05175 [Accumulibacter sp.]|uniref:hypothetical protein n=1 Tax=Accumulibacter sp. TaxID=2053492 RepID=UPI0026007E2B|nr:hypothetical protein [Accumulibacter sp.]MCM8599716.1 hypothetical protein [Accumulibacter sp.]MCM8664399.1 hypothetical protein [Accumulibacter sp.]HNC51616.1 hypothetical protein [Accumulibacter sp.]HNI73849.1 hypothetical protein [Accumulibacter sp.]